MKSIKNISLVLISFITFTSYAQWGNKTIKGNGNVITKNITTSGYDKVNVAGAFKVFLTDGKEGKIKVEGEENLLEYVEIETKDNALNIRTQKGYELRTSGKKVITITVPVESISAVSLAGSGDIIGEYLLKEKDFTIKLAGSGDIKLALESQNIAADVAGSGDIELKGKAVKLTAKVAGSGDIDAYELIAENVSAHVAGSGDCEVYCTEFLEARVAGSGDIYYKGKPKKTDTKVAGSGSITMK